MSGDEATANRIGRIASWEPSTPPDLVADSVEEAFEEVAPSVNGPLVARLVPIAGAWPSLPMLEIYRDNETIVVGRSRELPMEHRVDVPRVSGRHCELRVNAVTRQVTIRDVSLNGTFVNGKRLEKGTNVELQPGDEVSLVKPAPGSKSAVSSSVPVVASSEGECEATAGRGAEYIIQRVSNTQSAEKMAEELTCSVCKFLYYRPCSVLPCLHVFCASCISKWLDRGQTTCIECRSKLTEVRPTHKLQNCVEQLLKLDPGLGRSAQELADCERSNNIPPGGKKLVKRTRSSDYDDDYSGESDSYSESHSTDNDAGNAHIPQLYRGQSHGHVPASGYCRHCEAPAVSDGFRCPSGGMHQSCAQCHRLFPLRPLCTRPQRCHLCSTPFCNLYYEDEDGCAAGTGRGLVLVSQHRTPSFLPPRLFGGNAVERNILLQYLASKQVGINDVWMECLAKLESSEWIPDITCINGPVTVNSALCESCLETLFAALLFHYRRCILRSDLPDEVTERPNCWYGLNCRTQFHSMHHANKYNHACYQEKRKE